jgi:hypothetical protein
MRQKQGAAVLLLPLLPLLPGVGYFIIPYVFSAITFTPGNSGNKYTNTLIK